jgi:hypothetical protein
MQNKPNFRKSQMNVSIFSKMAYENKSNWTLGENKPNFRKAKMNVNSLITKDYRKNDAFAVQKNKPNSNPIQTQTKPISKALRNGPCYQRNLLSIYSVPVGCIEKINVTSF